MKFILLVALASSLLTLSQSARADDPKTDIAVRGGIGIFSGSSIYIDLGGSVDYAFSPPFSAGLLFDYISEGTNTFPQGGQTTTSLMLPMADLNYNMRPVYLGAAVGMGLTHVTVTQVGNIGTSSTTSSFYFGPRVGYDFPVVSMLTFGGEAAYLITPTNGASNVLQILANLKFWL